MSFCDKCGAYIPIGDTVCPACGYDPEAEAKKAREEAERAAEEERRRAEEAAQRERAEAAEKARLEAEQRQREEQERQRAQQQQRWQQDPRQYTHSGGPAQGQYASQRTGTSQAHYASQRTGYKYADARTNRTQYSNQNPSYYDQAMRQQAGDSVSNQKLSVLSYLGMLWLIPFITRRNDTFSRYHSNQGLVLLVTAALLNVLGSVSSIFPIVGTLGYLVGAVFGITNVLRGKREPLPLIGKINLLK